MNFVLILNRGIVCILEGLKTKGYEFFLYFRTACLFTWRESAPANRATRLERLKYSPPWPLSTTNITTDQGNFFASYFSFLHGSARACACSLPETRLLHGSLQTDCSVWQITLAKW